MTKMSAETFTALADAVAASLPYEAAARSVGLSEASLWRWIKESKNGNPAFVFEYQGERMALHEVLKQNASIGHVAILQSAEHRARYGVWTQSHYKGRPQYQEDPRYYGWSDEDFELLGIDPSQRWLRDEDGALVPVMIWEPPPVQLLQTVLAARFPKVYGHKQQIEVNQKQTGVTVVKHQFERPPEIAKPVEVIAAPILDAEPEATFEEIAPEEIKSALHPECSADLPEPVPVEEPEAMPEPGHNPEIKKEYSPLRAQLEALARARAAAGPQPVRPPPSNGFGDRDDSAPLTVRPVGVKIK